MAEFLKLATVVSHPIQYHAPLYRALAATEGVDFTALFLSEHGVKPTFDSGFGATIAFDVPLLEGYQHRFVPNRAPHAAVHSFTGAINPGLVPLLRRERYDFIWVHGWAQASSWLTFGAARATGTPFGIKGDSNLMNTPRPTARLAKQLILGGLIREAAALLYIGIENRRFYEAHGARPEQLFFTPFGVDNAYFSGRAEAARSSGEATALRDSLGAKQDDVVLLFCGKLQQQIKRLLDLVEAAKHLGPQVVLAFVGDGADRALLEEALARAGVRGRLVGFANQSQLPAWYAAADVLVLPSFIEAWGLVVNEAMACGLPAVVSDRVGCALDLVIPGETGAIHRACDPLSLADALRPLVENPELRRRMGENARRHVARYDVSQAAAGIVEAARTVKTS